ncbi:EF-hand domain-containing protein D2 [Trichoplax sp. H2]|uniref:EF-hand domain-containing protein n=1 Tax=Trichoplax adhaerens TaxID=10228 RepID=B3RZU5_TRIAD|nr:hypothetical protein TRIADDRAFT_26114 [Trichoplax adhaerens]EDV23902.1 hypothetical protein TRIADDRAFT_26114 [Trichoplax adhaerens]RDD44019.1 EF-hand domain-containing protein D2 [Trichoplax sp. H2]|eukprot:XP_002113428.1 hypothetical protein TRIADDRAFT_26114 [Trichoplax adhaerens]
MCDSELSAKLARRQEINEGVREPEALSEANVFNPYTEFKEFSRKQIKEFEGMFAQHDIDKNGFIDMQELKLMMEKLGNPQTHSSLKNILLTVDEDKDNMINFREFLLLFRHVAAGDLTTDSDAMTALANLAEIDVGTAGVKNAKSFFEAKIDKLSIGKKREEEIKAEQEEKKKSSMEAAERRKNFNEKMSVFK